MVDPAADAHRILLQRPQTRQGLAGIANLGLGSLDGGNPGGGGGGDTGKMTEEVEQGAFGSQQTAGVGFYSQQCLTGLQAGAVLHPVQHPVAVGAENLVEHHQRDGYSGGDARFASDKGGLGSGVDGHRRDGRHVGSVAQILVQSAADRQQRLGTLVGCQRHGVSVTTAVGPIRYGRGVRLIA